MTIYHTFISDVGIGTSTILGIQQNGSQYGIGISADIECNTIIAGIVSASQVFGDYVGLVTFSSYSDTSGYSSISGISTLSEVAQALTGNPNITVGIITATSYVSSGNTSVFSSVGITTVDSNISSFHYTTYNTNNTEINISNFTEGKTFRIVLENTAGGNRTFIVKTSSSTSDHTTVPKIVHTGGTVTNGTISVSSGSGSLVTIFNMNGTIIGHYG